MIRMREKETTIPIDVTEKFGEILFGDFRDMNEPDTEYEERIFKMVQDWIAGEQMGEVDIYDLEDALYELRELKEYYPEVLEPSIQGKLIHRAALASRMLLMGSIPTERERYSYDEESGLYVVERYMPAKSVESWTTSFSYAMRFGRDMEATFDEPLAIISAQPKDEEDFLFDVSFMNNLAKDTLGVKEDEILRVSGQFMFDAWVEIEEEEFNALLENGDIV